MFLTELGIVTDVRPVKPLHKLAGIILTFAPKVKFEILLHPLNICPLTYKQLSALNITDDRELQSENAL